MLVKRLLEFLNALLIIRALLSLYYKLSIHSFISIDLNNNLTLHLFYMDLVHIKFEFF